GARLWEAMALPGDGAPGFACERRERQSGGAREAALDRTAAAGVVDEVEVLVEPDRERGTHAHDQPVGDSRLGLRQRPGAGGVGAAEVLPPPGEVAVEVDAVCVATRSEEHTSELQSLR